VVGKVPRKVTFDASAIFGEFNLRDYLLSRDTNGDGENDRENDPIYTFVYNYAQLYSIDVRFPGLNWYLYTFPLRVEPSDVPVCLVASKALKGTQYELSTTFLDRAKIDEYGFSIIDIADDKVIERIKSTTDLLNYTFPRPGSYAVKVDFVTDEGKQGYCESDDFDVGSSDFDINYDIYYKSPQAPTYAKAGAGSGDVVSLANDIITIQQIPTIIQLRITKISPNNPNATTRVFFNDSAIVALEPGIYEVKFDSETSKDISVTIEDAERGAKTEKNHQRRISSITDRTQVIDNSRRGRKRSIYGNLWCIQYCAQRYQWSDHLLHMELWRWGDQEKSITSDSESYIQIW
jgi:hypothetical protein